MKEITSKNNETVKFIKSLGLAKTRKKEKLFIVEGMRFVKDAIAYGITPKLLCATNSVDISFFTDCEKILVSENVFRYRSDVKSPQGILGVFELPIYELKNFSGEKVVYMQGVQMSENVGAVIRSAACCGFDAVFIDNCTADAFSPKSIRASAANIFKIKIFGTHHEIFALRRAFLHADACAGPAELGRDNVAVFKCDVVTFAKRLYAVHFCVGYFNVL